MPFAGDRILLANLVKIELPSRDIRICDGAFLSFDGEAYASTDPEFGSVAGVGLPSDMAGDEAPGATMVLLPPTTSGAAALCNPTFQNSRVRFWMVQVDEMTGQADDLSAELLADMRIDVPRLKVSRNARALEIDLMGSAERLFLVNRGNTLSPRFHKSVWPGEKGFDNATGQTLQVAWGVAGPPRGSRMAAGGGNGSSTGYGGGGGNVVA